MGNVQEGIFMYLQSASVSCVCLLLLAQRKLTYTTAANQPQQSVLPATSSQCMLEPYGHVAGAVAASEVDPQATLVWQQRLTASSDALQNTVDVQSHANSLSQVCQVCHCSSHSYRVMLCYLGSIVSCLAYFFLPHSIVLWFVLS